MAEFLLKHLDPVRVRGVVFLDDRDRKMVLVRSTMRAVELEDSGIGPDQRFAFYDQVLFCFCFLFCFWFIERIILMTKKF